MRCKFGGYAVNEVQHHTGNEDQKIMFVKIAGCHVLKAVSMEVNQICTTKIFLSFHHFIRQF